MARNARHIAHGETKYDPARSIFDDPFAAAAPLFKAVLAPEFSASVGLRRRFALRKNGS
jgi:hypothetical protein